MTHTSIFACRDPRGLHWQLGPLPPAVGRLTLFGWSHIAEQQDAGVPEEVAHVLARALISVARVTFPSSSVNPVATSVWSPQGGDLIRGLTERGFGARIAAKLRGTPPDIALMSTRRSETAVRLFDDAGFPWWLQGQVVLLSEPEAIPPDIDEDALVALFEEDWTRHVRPLGPVGVVGILRAAVDGDAAGLLTLTDGFEEVVLAALERETLRAGFDWALLPEGEFMLR